MARTVAQLPPGTRITDHISLGVVSRTFPPHQVRRILADTGKASIRERDLPAHAVVYYVILLAFYMRSSYREVLRCLLEGLQWLVQPSLTIKVAGRSAISQARTRLGSEPLKRLYDEVVVPLATPKTKGAWYRKWRVISLDGSILDTADTPANEAEFGRPGANRGKSAFPQISFVALVENGTHILFGARMGSCRTSEVTLAEEVLGALRAPMLCLADRGYWGFALWQAAAATGAQLLWRAKTNLVLAHCKRLPDGSYLSKVYASMHDREQDRGGINVRVIEYTLSGVADAEPMYRLVTTILDPKAAPARELAVLYHERWEIENAFDEFKTHLRGARIVLRSKTPDLVRQEFFGLLMAHFAIRGLMHEAALDADEDPDRLSFTHAVHVLRRKLPRTVGVSPSADGNRPPDDHCGDSGGAGGVQPRPAQSARGEAQDDELQHPATGALADDKGRLRPVHQSY